MAETWNDSEIDACVRTYLWMRDAEAQGHTPHKTRIREALIAGPLEDRSHGSIDYRFGNISAVLEQRGESWIAGYKPAENVGTHSATRISKYIDDYGNSRSSRRMNWLLNALPATIIQQAVKELSAGQPFNYPDSTDYDVVVNGKPLPPKKIIGYAGLLYYDAPLFSGNFSAGYDSRCFKRIEEAGFEVQEKAPPDLTNPEADSFRGQVKKYKPADFKTPPRGNKKPSKKTSSSNSFERDPKVVSFVEWRADGICELCGQPAPFLRPDGTPYLEVHHIVPLSEDGPDSGKNAAGLCPNCHRACHHGSDTEAHQSYLRATVIELANEAPIYDSEHHDFTLEEEDQSAMWLRPDPDAASEVRYAYALTIDGHFYSQETWGEDMLDGQSGHRIEAAMEQNLDSYSFEDLRGLLYIIQRAIKWGEGPGFDRRCYTAFDHVYELICSRWSAESQEHLPQVQSACRRLVPAPDMAQRHLA